MRKAFAAAVAASFIAMAAPAAASLPQFPFDEEEEESVAPVAVLGPCLRRTETAWVTPPMTEQPYVGMFLAFIFWGGVVSMVGLASIWLLRLRVP